LRSAAVVTTVLAVVAGQLLLVGLSTGAGIAKIKAETTAASGYQRIAETMLASPHVEGELLVSYRPEASGLNKTLEDGILLGQGGLESTAYVRQEVDGDLKSELVDLLKDPQVWSVQPNYIYEMADWTQTVTTSKPEGYNDSRNWYYNQSKLPEMWKAQNCPAGPLCGGSSDVVVAVIDSGLAFESFDDSAGFTGALFPQISEYAGLNLYTNAGETAGDGIDNDCNGVVDDVHGIDSFAVYIMGTNTCPGGIPNPSLSINYRKGGHPVDNHGHGSYVTGLIAGDVENGATPGYDMVSPAFNVTIMPIAANTHFTIGFATSSLVIALDYASLNGADIINMSLGGSAPPDSAFKNAIDLAVSRGSFIVAAAGNSSGSVEYPARYSNVLAVGAVNSNGSKSYYSSYGAELDVVAYVGAGSTAGNAAYQNTLSCYSVSPGCSSDDLSPRYVGDATATATHSIGTSFAAPQVSALAALIKSKNPSLNHVQLRDYILASTDDLGSAGWDSNTGYGVINFQKGWNLNLTGTPTDVYRFWSDTKQKHFYTISTAERDDVINNYPDDVWKYETIAFDSYPQTRVGYSPVYRFWSDTKQGHFYTINESEKSFVENNYPDEVWKLEGIAYYASSVNSIGTKPLYRFWSDTKQSHFYTSDTTERDAVINNYPDEVWRYEMIAYYIY
jgi:subtilisin family serine protease